MSGLEKAPGERGTGAPAADPRRGGWPDAGTLETVAGGAGDLRREVGRMLDGRDITYYWSSQEPAPADGDRSA